jgi:hypothetical protein
MKKLIILLLSAFFSIWGAYDFKRIPYGYAVGYFLNFPIKSLAILCLMLVSFFLTYKLIYIPINETKSKIDKVLVKFHPANIDTDNPNYEIAFSRILNELLKPNLKTLTPEKKLLEFIDCFRVVYDYLPNELSVALKNSQIVGIQNITQLKAVYIKKYKHTVIFIKHETNKPDKTIEYTTFDAEPSIDTLRNIFDPNHSLPDRAIISIPDTFERWLNGEISIHGDMGYSGNGYIPNSEPYWYWIGIPDQITDYNFRKIVGECVGFQKSDSINYAP